MLAWGMEFEIPEYSALPINPPNFRTVGLGVGICGGSPIWNEFTA